MHKKHKKAFKTLRSSSRQISAF